MDSTEPDARPSNHESWIRNSSGATSPEPDERSSKRLKRGNYVSKAWYHASKTQNPPRGQKEGFSGETSINHALGEIEGYLRHVRELHSQPEPSASRETSVFLPSSPRGNSRHPGPSEILRNHGITPDFRQWSIFVQNFSDEVHVLFPFLHLPTLWTNHTTMWNDYILTPSIDDSEYTADNRLMMAQVWICVAIGKCTASPRSNTQQGKHSSGWSLYRASLDLIGDLFRSFQDCLDQMLVVYLFRVDANERAEKVLAIAISHAHHLGLHRSKVVNAMSAFNSELFRRVWWCLYVLDRRIAIETGHPVLIQDNNVDSPYPQCLGDGWLAAHQDDPKSCSDLNSDIDAEVNREIVTPIPYLIATIKYSMVVGKVWEAVYGARDSDLIPDPTLLDHLENTISQAQGEVRIEFSLLNQERQSNPQTSVLAWWQIKQQMIMRIRWLCLRLLIRKPLLRETSSSSHLQNDTTCISIARDILQRFSEVPEAKAKSAFPFLHYLVGATMVSLGLVCKQPDSKQTLGALTLQAAHSLERYCQNTWVSGRMVRTIWKLNQMVKTVIESPIPSRSHLPPAQMPLSMTPRLRGRPYRHSLLSNFPRNSSDQTLHSTIGTSARFPGIANLANAFGPNARSHHTQFLQHPSTAGIPNLLMTDFDFEERVNNFPATQR
ncbi:hypothetical protein P170DRAFT_406892 [Aspergillus steynii IBT 23096]|uniref:Xylanolytic transcriptional activator regulatory domain-containing protein n=1 Tax=Aspergillus steynii IBT 23096 TaxID=1392250 RepID=A0A2I2GE55_9EURO|nr:uncharacterized protein P170DRAFT_406892 [Aspergillus steynii IBT 23096]PLB51189.1 hypothetical protein P170DRAFT_406892 [Aspergillus steynii IBT 23096]